MSLISNNLEGLLWNQIVHEMYNANLYMYMCGYLRNSGFDNLAKIFEKQREEELSHANEFFNLLTDLNAKVAILEVEEVEIEFENVVSLAKYYLEAEILTTNSINTIKEVAIAEKNPVVEERMRKMILKQQHEYEEATTFLDKAEIMKEPWQVLLWDSSLG